MTLRALELARQARLAVGQAYPQYQVERLLDALVTELAKPAEPPRSAEDTVEPVVDEAPTAPATEAITKPKPVRGGPKPRTNPPGHAIATA